jgi:hypothetical protein
MPKYMPNITEAYNIPLILCAAACLASSKWHPRLCRQVMCLLPNWSTMTALNKIASSCKQFTQQIVCTIRSCAKSVPALPRGGSSALLSKWKWPTRRGKSAGGLGAFNATVATLFFRLATRPRSAWAICPVACTGKLRAAGLWCRLLSPVRCRMPQDLQLVCSNTK